MSTTQEVLENEVSTFYEDTTKDTRSNNGTTKYQAKVAGDYLGHITSVQTLVRPIKDRFQARIYNCKVTVADEHAKMTHQYEDIDGKHVEISGEQFVGEILRANGVFKFLEPTNGDSTFEANPSGNYNYSKFCETLGLQPKEETRVIDGKDTVVKLLPTLTEEHILGRPVTARLEKVKDNWVNKKGEQMNWSFKVVKFLPWTTGTVKNMTLTEGDLPF